MTPVTTTPVIPRFRPTLSARPPRSALVVALLVTASLALAAPPARAQLQTPSYRGFEPTDDLIVQIDGEAAPGVQLYRTSNPPAFLLMGSELPAPVLLAPGTGRVETIHLMKLAKRSDGSIDLLPGATLAPQGGFQPDGQAVSFTVEGRSVRLEPRPPLLGAQEKQDLKDYSSLYQTGAESYSPSSSALAGLKKLDKDVRVKVFFGSWCEACKRTVPHIVRVADELDSTSNIDFDFYGLPPQGLAEEPEARRFGVKAVPTGIVFVDGREVGRLEGNSWLAPEKAIQSILDGGA